MTIKYVIINYMGNSSAAINRCRFLCKGLKKQKIDCSILEIASNKKSSKFFKLIFGITYLLKISRILLTTKNKETLIFYGHFPFLGFLKLLKSNRYTLIGERNEYPAHILYHADRNNSYSRSINYCNNATIFDAFISCSDKLLKFYKPFLKSNINTLLIPSVVDTKMFEINTDKRLMQKDLVTYCGDWSNNKDGVEILIRAFKIFNKDFNSYKLKLIGGTANMQDRQNILHLIESLQLTNSVIIEGRVPHNKVPILLNESKILALARPANIQAEAGFPSKLTEYLSTGIPTLVTNVGELSKYYKDGVNIFMSEPDSPEHFADKLKFIAKNYRQSIQIAKNGKIQNKQFDYLNQAHLLIKFIKMVK